MTETKSVQIGNQSDHPDVQPIISDLSAMALISFSTVDVNIARVILEAVIIIAIRLQPVHSAYMRRFVNALVKALMIETVLIASYAYMIHSALNIRLAMIIWKMHKVVRLFVSISLCYPIIVLINYKVKLHIVFFLLASIIIGGGVVDCMKSNPGAPSGFNNIAFMLIFLFTFQQYYKLKQHTYVENGAEIKGLKSLMAIEMALIFLNALLIILFFSGSTHFLQSLRLSITLVQYLKIYMIMSLFTSFKTV